MSHIIRVDREVYQHLVEAKAKLEVATGKASVTMSDTVAFLAALKAWSEDEDCAARIED